MHTPEAGPRRKRAATHQSGSARRQGDSSRGAARAATARRVAAVAQPRSAPTAASAGAFCLSGRGANRGGAGGGEGGSCLARPRLQTTAGRGRGRSPAAFVPTWWGGVDGPCRGWDAAPPPPCAGVVVPSPPLRPQALPPIPPFRSFVSAGAVQWHFCVLLCSSLFCLAVFFFFFFFVPSLLC